MQRIRLTTHSLKRNVRCYTFGLRQFSCYEDYNVTSKDYDKRRHSVGVDVICNALTRMNMDYSNIKMLDAGCGTGNYIQSIYDLGITDIYGVELNDGMLSECKAKHKTKIQCGHLTVHQASLLEVLPFEDETFDSICINQVLHHLDDDTSRMNNFANIRFALAELYRCLDKNGVLFVNHSTPIQILIGTWYYQFMPDCAERLCPKFPYTPWMERQLKNTGFKVVECHKIVESLWGLDNYYNLHGVFAEKWRNGDSGFACLSGEELENVQKAVKRILETEKSTDLFIQQCEEQRHRVGHSTTFVAYK